MNLVPGENVKVFSPEVPSDEPIPFDAHGIAEISIFRAFRGSGRFQDLGQCGTERHRNRYRTLSRVMVQV